MMAATAGVRAAVKSGLIVVTAENIAPSITSQPSRQHQAGPDGSVRGCRPRLTVPPYQDHAGGSGEVEAIITNQAAAG